MGVENITADGMGEVARLVATNARHVSADIGCAHGRDSRLSVEFTEQWTAAEVAISTSAGACEWLSIDERGALQVAVAFLTIVGLMREARGADSSLAIVTEPPLIEEVHANALDQPRPTP